MNKKLFLGMFVAAGMLLATSCSNDELDVVQSGNEAQVTFSLGLEGGIATRAISDGKSADVLMYAVFDKDGERIETIQKVSKTGVTFPTTENITLAKGQTYKVAFWAQDKDCEAYTVTDDMQVTVNYANNENNENNDETRDAFFKTVEFTVTGSTSIDVELKRPFAQINVGVTQEDWDAAKASGITIAQSSVVIKKAATSLNLLDGTVDGETEVSYALANIPSNPAILKVDTDGNGVKEEYKWLSMSYILPLETTTGYEKTTLENVAFVFASAGEPIEFNQGLNSVPVQRNWRTNILGKLLTGDITFNIVIDEEFEDDHNVMVPYTTINGVAYPSFADAMAAVQDGETIKLEGETTLDGVADGYLFTIDDKSITIDLNGYGFVANVPDVTKNSAIFRVATNSGLTIEGEGNVKVTTNKASNVLAAFINNDGGTVNLKGGNWTMTALEYPDALIPTFVDNNSNVNSATLNIYDGTYTFHRNLFRNFANAAGHNNYETVATMNIYGGTFNGRESDAGTIWNQKPSSNINVPATAGVINVMGGTFNNVNINDEFSGLVYVNNNDELNSALNNANTHTVMLGAGKYVPSLYPGDIPTRKSLTIIGSEGTQFAYTGSNYAGQFSLTGFDNVTIRNCEILKREGVKEWGMIVFGSSNNPNGVYTFENCTFTGVGTQGIYINENTSGATYNILNCTFDGDFGNEGAITIQNNDGVNHIVNVTGCTFNNIPTTSHKIFVHYAYNGWTLNTDLEASTAYEVVMFAKLGLPTRVYGLTLTPNGNNSKIIVNDKEGFLNLTKLFADWTDLFTDGNGTTLTNYANGAGVDYYYSGRWTVSLEADIDLNNETINPVAIKHPVSAGKPTFDGSNHTIKNAKIVTSTSTQNEAGLFNASSFSMKNLKLDNIHVTGSNVGNSTAGVLAGSNNSGVENITVTNSSVTGGKYTGGVVGYGYTSITGCNLNSVTVKGGYKLGGLIGYICADSGNNNDVTGNTLTDCKVDGIGGDVYAGGKSEYIIGKLVGNYNCDGTCNNNTITNMFTSATENIGKIEDGMTVTE
jgi:hypothetical protein